MNKTLVFDMDGTLANFYGVANWLDYLVAENTFPYESAEPLCDMNTLYYLLSYLKNKGWRVVITTWLAKNSTKDFSERTTKAKKEWLKKYHFPADEVNVLQYGKNKNKPTKKYFGRQILFDDDMAVRANWTGETVDANFKENIFNKLVDLIAEED